jgi:predicted ATP-grasp superfamily ATP-dependent carboligase
MKSKIFKDKNAFRLALSKEFPNFYYKKLDQKSLKNIKLSEIPFPVVLKPAIGISSIGVVRVKSSSEWNRAVEYLHEDLKKYQKNYESNVVDSTEFIIEKYIEGPELAIDGYFNSNAEPVILNILEHLFKNADDTSDRIYYTRRSLLKKYLKPVQEFLIRFGDVFDLKRFPFHLELRQDPKMGLIPIELNPLRFSGLGTCELAEYAYGLNVYRYFFKEQKPDWDSILSRKDDSVYSFMCADLPDAFFRKKGLRIQDREFMKEFKEVLDYRMLDEEETSTFAVIFFRDQDHADNKKFLNMNFERFLKLSNPRKGKS